MRLYYKLIAMQFFVVIQQMMRERPLHFKRRAWQMFLLSHSPKIADHKSFSPGTSHCSSGSQQQHGSGQAAGSCVRSWKLPQQPLGHWKRAGMGPSGHLVSQKLHKAWDLDGKMEKEGKRRRLVPHHPVIVSTSKLLSMLAANSVLTV